MGTMDTLDGKYTMIRQPKADNDSPIEIQTFNYEDATTKMTINI